MLKTLKLVQTKDQYRRQYNANEERALGIPRNRHHIDPTTEPFDSSSCNPEENNSEQYKWSNLMGAIDEIVKPMPS
jgi:hypothetical protein